MPAHLKKAFAPVPKPAPPEPVAKRLGTAVRRQRKAKKLTQERLAERAELSTNYVGNIERGEYDVTVPVLQRMASAMGCKASTLLDIAGL